MSCAYTRDLGTFDLSNLPSSNFSLESIPSDPRIALLQRQTRRTMLCILFVFPSRVLFFVISLAASATSVKLFSGWTRVNYSD